MVTLGLAGVAFLVFLAGTAREPRAFGNAVLLGLALALAALGVAERLADTPGRAAHLLLLAFVLAVALVPFAIGCYLLAKGRQPARLRTAAAASRNGLAKSRPAQQESDPRNRQASPEPDSSTIS